MARSHPPTLITLVRRTLREECSLKPGQRLLVAVSGGTDSSALLHVLSGLRKELGVSVWAHGVDHGLRPQAPRELDVAERLANRLQVDFSRSRVAVRPGGNLQARAREARLEELETVRQARACDVTATAHHADDRAETVLIRLLRGASPAGLAAMPPRDGVRVFPMIRARRRDVVRHLERHRIAYCEDPSNNDRRFLRARVRHEILPLLESVSPGIVGHLNALADQLAAGPPPRLWDSQGHPIPLRRPHVEQIRRALRSPTGHTSRVRLPGGREVRVDPRQGTVHLVEAPPAHARSKKRSRDKTGGAKPLKSG